MLLTHRIEPSGENRNVFGFAYWAGVAGCVASAGWAGLATSWASPATDTAPAAGSIMNAR